MATINRITPTGKVNGITGIQDCFHFLMVGPCDPATAEVEAECPLVLDIGVTSAEDFDCTYEEWVQHLRDDVLQAAEEKPDKLPPPLDIAERVQQAMTSGLEDGARIERRDNGWVVVVGIHWFLVDPDDAYWMRCLDDEGMPPTTLFLPTPEAAFLAWKRFKEVAGARIRRRIEALKLLGKSSRLRRLAQTDGLVLTMLKGRSTNRKETLDE